MKIVLGQELDSGGYPDGLGDQEATVGNVVVGPAGFIGILETRLGLSRVRPHEAVRISQCLRYLKDLDDGKKFYSRSFQEDAWSTGKTILGWRDELRLAGWKGDAASGGSDRLRTLCELEERSQNQLVEGMGDRLQSILSALKCKPNLDIEQIQLLESRGNWAFFWQSLFDSLVQCGVTVHEFSSNFSLSPGNLGVLQNALETGNPSNQNLTPDASLWVVRTPTEWEACEAIASFLEADQENNRGTLIIKSRGKDLFDDTLHRHNLPRLGHESRSRWRTALQVLPLVLANYWEPLDAQRLLEFLMLPRSPISPSARSHLAKALREHPGIGGQKWNDAIEEAVKEYESQSQDDQQDPSASNSADDFRQGLQFWLGEKRYDPNQGIPSAVIIEICSRLSQWAGKVGGPENDEILLKSAAIFRDVKEVIKASTLSEITEPQLSRILDSVVGEGLEGPDAAPQAAPWSVVNTPGQIWGPADTIIWWNFTSAGPDPLHAPWGQDESTALSSLGVRLRSTTDRRLHEAKAWRNAVKCARQRLLLVAPMSIAGTEVNYHPFWDEIRYLLDKHKKNTSKFLFDGTLLWRESCSSLMGKDLHRNPLPMVQLPEAQREWNATPNVIHERPKESASSMQELIECPLAWVFHYVLRLRSGDMVSLPSGSAMLGTLGHAVFEKTFDHRQKLPSPVEAETSAREHFNKLVSSMASPLLLLQRKPERDSVRKKVGLGAKKLAELIEKSQLAIKAQESDRNKDFRQNQQFGGRIDLILGDDTEEKMVIDFKWSNDARYKREELKKGEALQLAAYAWLLHDGNKPFPAGAYYLLAQSELVSSECSFFPPECVFSNVDLKSIWSKSVQIYEQRIQELQGGVVRAEGVALKEDQASRSTNKSDSAQAADPEALNLVPKCNFCDFANLCGVGGQET